MSSLCLWLFVKAISLNLAGLVAWAWYRALRAWRRAQGLGAWAALLSLLGLRLMMELASPVNLQVSDLQARPGMVSVALGIGTSERFAIHFLSVAVEVGHRFLEAGNAVLSLVGSDCALKLGGLLALWSLLSLAGFARENLGLIRALGACRQLQGVDGVWVSPQLPSMAVGWLRPRVVLSEEDAALDPSGLQAVLAHERGHASHRDPLRSWILELAVRAFPFVLPLRFWARDCRLYFEVRSDQAAIRAGVPAPRLARLLCSRSRSAAPWLPASRGSDRYVRISALLTPAPITSSRGLVGLTLLAAILLLGTHIL